MSMSEPQKVTIGPCDLWLGDCSRILPLLDPVDLILTDPPYGIDYGNAGGFSASSGWTQWRGQAEWDKDRPSPWLFGLMREKGKTCVIWGGNYFTDLLPPTMRWLVWDKGQRDFTLADCEFAWSSENKAARVFTLSRAVALQDGKEHPTQKPIALMEWCIGLHPKSESVCDPFMGSGTTGVACVNLGRKFIGIEREPRYFEIAVKRITHAVEQSKHRLFDPEPEPQPDQPTLGLDASA